MRFSPLIYFLSLIVLLAAVWYGRGTLRKRVTLVVDKVSQALAQNPRNQDNHAAHMQNTNSNSQENSPLGLEESEEEEFEEELKAEKFTLDESLFVFPNQKPDNNGYVGEMQNGEYHGRGILVQKDGSKHIGYWKRNKRHGHGKTITAAGDVYIGDWFWDRQHGLGRLVTADGDIYEGEWKHGVEDGYGVYYWANDGSKYEGFWKEGAPHGYGKWTDGNVIFEGQWVDGRRHGPGKLTRKADGRVIFDGEWRDDKPVERLLDMLNAPNQEQAAPSDTASSFTRTQWGAKPK